MQNGRILLVEVSDASRAAMVRRLTTQGYAVEAAADPMHGADLALSAPPQVVIADFWMPGISGIQLDLFSQFLAQVLSYRWVGLATQGSQRFALHHHPLAADDAEREARAALGVSDGVPVLRIVDDDAHAERTGGPPVVCAVPFGGAELGRLALAPCSTAEADTHALVALVARELGGPVRIAGLLDEQERLATIDPLTTLRNPRVVALTNTPLDGAVFADDRGKNEGQTGRISLPGGRPEVSA